ncbi:MAG: Na(+)-translocating NADH-quinone reductase subunit C [Pseudomonadales bacterium]|nr:Na(+)-translocating NADH-quinone reductase subunit C [Pseudomonadales bacterium]
MLNKEAINTLVVAMVLCLVCSILVSAVAVALKPQQTANKELDLRKNIISAAGLLKPNATAEDINDTFAKFESKLVDIETGMYVDSADNTALVARADAPAGLATVKQYQEVFVYQPTGTPELYVLPIYGPGLWGAMYGFLVLESDANTIKGLSYYQHKETPGLGANVELDSWKSLWQGKSAFADNGKVNIVVGSKNISNATPKTDDGYIDGLSGATLTTAGVNSMIRFWLGEPGFANYLNNIKAGEA